MLVYQNVEERILEFQKLIVASAGHRDCLALAWGCVFLDEVLDIVVIYVICSRIVSGGNGIGMRDQAEQSHDVGECGRQRMAEGRCYTYGDSMQVWIAASTSRRTSSSSLVAGVEVNVIADRLASRSATSLGGFVDVLLRHAVSERGRTAMYFKSA